MTTSNQFLLDGLSFVTKTDGDTATVVRTSTGSALTQTEKNVAGDYYDATQNEIKYAEIYNLAFGANYLNQLGGSDDWMSKALTDPVYKNAFKKATGKNSPNINFASAKDAEKLWEPTQQNEDANGKSTSRRTTTLSYPLNESQRVKYDYLQVSAHEHKANDSTTQEGGFGAFTDADERVGRSLGKCFLPMQPGLGESQGVDWNQGTANPFEAAGFGAARSAIQAPGGVGDKAKELMKKGLEAFDNMKEDLMSDDVASYFAAQAVGNNSLFTRGTGKVLNPNLELLFQGPKLRQFNYAYRFTPREDKEAKRIRQIIKFFKKNMAPKRMSGNLFLKTPNVFKLKYIFKNGQQHPYLNKIKVCALQSFDIQYTPDGSYSTYDDGSMTSYDVRLGFGELNPIYAEDYIRNKNDMGF